jgi:anthranilate phosphoribosyltransferase
MSDLKPFIAKAASGRPLDRAEAERAFDMVMSGAATPSQIGGLLMALRVRGETVDEIAGAVSADARQACCTVDVRRPTPSTSSARAATVPAPTTSRPARGDRRRGLPASRSPSTATGRSVVEVGARRRARLRSASSSSIGRAEIASRRASGKPASASCSPSCTIAAMKHVGPSRVELGTRTIFNLLGPLSNPASVQTPARSASSRRTGCCRSPK